MGDKSRPHVDDVENNGLRKQKNSVRPVPAVRPVQRPKPPRKNAAKEKAACSSDVLEGSAAVPSSRDATCNDQSNCKVTAKKDCTMVIDNQWDSTMETGSEKEGLVEWVPAVHSIILALEHESAAIDVHRSFTTENRSLLELGKPDRFSRCRFSYDFLKKDDSLLNSDVKKDSLPQSDLKKSQMLSTTKKTPPQVPIKTFKCDQSRTFQTQTNNSSLSVSNKATHVPRVKGLNRQQPDYKRLSSDAGISLSEVEKLQLYYSKYSPIIINENCVDGLQQCSEVSVDVPDGLCNDSLKNFERRACLGSGRAVLDSPEQNTSSSTGSLVKEQPDGFDAEELECKLKSITSFTTEDVEFCQRLEPLPSPGATSHHVCEVTQNVKRKKDAAKEAGFRMKERARNRRSRSVGAPGFHLKDFYLHNERPKVPAKPKNRVRRAVAEEQSSSAKESVSVPEPLQIFKAVSTGKEGSGTFEPAIDLQGNENGCKGSSSMAENKSVIDSGMTDLRTDKGNQTVVSEEQIDLGPHLTVASTHKPDGARVKDSASVHFTEKCSDFGGQNMPKLHFTEFSFDLGVQSVPKSTVIDVSSNLKVQNAPKLDLTEVSGELIEQITPEYHLNAVTSASELQTSAELNFTEVSEDSKMQNTPEPPIREVASDSKLQYVPKSSQRESLCDEDNSSTRSFEVTSQSESLASNFVDLDREISPESSESFASSSIVKLDELDSLSESRMVLNSPSGSCDHIEQEKPFDGPQAKNICCYGEALPHHSTRKGSTDPEIRNINNFPEFDLTFATTDYCTDVLDRSSHSSLYEEILKTISNNSSPQRTETRKYESPYSEGKAVLISTEVPKPMRRNSYDLANAARTLLAALDGVGVEMGNICTVEQKNCGDTRLTYRVPADGRPTGSTAILRKVSGCLPEDRKKLLNRKASRADSFKAWQRITRRPTRKSSSKRADSDLDDFNVEDLSLSDPDDFDVGVESFSEESDPEFDASSSLRRNQKTDRAKQLKMRTAFHIASELLTTESNYVRKLHLIDQVFHFEVVVRNREQHMFGGEVIPQMFSNIKSIYQFHHDFLLPQLDKRMKEWDTNPRIGDVMKKFAPFLKMYTEYVRNFDNAIETINYWMDRSSKFQKMIEEIQKLPECGHLSLQHHMLEPVQRVPRYQLLLKDYLRHLSQDSDDRQDTVDALELVTQAARHSNEVMRNIQKFRKLIDINESLGGTIDLVSVTREFIKEGKLTKISARDGSHMDRYLFLFNDLFLICQSLPLNIGQKLQYRIKSRMDFDGMEIVTDGHNLETANTFYVKGKQKSVELHASSAEEKNEWMTAFRNAIAEIQTNHQRDTLPDEQIGKRAPTWIKDQETSMCMICSAPFNAFRRRHHCRACGHVVCSKCSSRRAPLAYAENREKRVCDTCFQGLYSVSHRKCSTESVDTVSSSDEPVRKKVPGVLQVKASDPAVIQGYLNMCCSRRTWSRRFFAVHENFVLYCFKAHQDVVALTSLPLPGYRVECDTTDDRIFSVFHRGQKKIFYFQAEDENTRKRWTEALQQLVKLQLPSESLCEPRSTL